MPSSRTSITTCDSSIGFASFSAVVSRCQDVKDEERGGQTLIILLRYVPSKPETVGLSTLHSISFKWFGTQYSKDAAKST